MRLFAILFLSFLMASFGFALTPNDTTRLRPGQCYEADDEGAVYTLTTEGEPVDAAIKVSANVTFVLKDCQIFANTLVNINNQLAVIEFTAANKTLTLLFSGENAIVANQDGVARSAILATGDSEAKLVIAEARGAQEGSSLFIRGCSTASQSVSPINLTAQSSVLFRSGKVTIATSESETSQGAIASLVSAGRVEMCGGMVTAQLCPRSTTGSLTGTQLSNSASSKTYIKPLFDCHTYVMRGGILTTSGEKCTSASHVLKATSQPYDTLYAYAQNPMVNLVPEAVSPTLLGGILRGPNTAYCYGLPKNTTIPAACFSHTYTGSSQLKAPTTDETGKATIANTHAFTDLTCHYVDARAQAIAEVIGVPLMPSETGFDARASLGISHVTLLPARQRVQLQLSLEMPDDGVTLEKPLLIQVCRTLNDGNAEVVYDGEVTFVRDTISNPTLSASVECADVASGVIGSLYYSIQAYN